VAGPGTIQQASPPPSALELLMIPGAKPSIKANYASLVERARDFTLASVEPEFVILDTETTGFDARADALTEVAAAIVCGSTTLDTFSTFVNPGRPVPPHITELTGISDADVADAPSADEVMRNLRVFCGERPIVAHNANFDQAFIQANYQRMLDRGPEPDNPLHSAQTQSGTAVVGSDTGTATELEALPEALQQDLEDEAAPLLSSKPWIDSVELARIALPLLREYNLEALSAVFAPDSRSTHRAIDDVLALARVWRVILVALSDLPAGLCGSLAERFSEQEWASSPVLQLIAEHQKAGLATSASPAASDTSITPSVSAASCTLAPLDSSDGLVASDTPAVSANSTTKTSGPSFDIFAVREQLTRHLREQQKVDAAELEGGIATLTPVEAGELAEEYTASGLLGMMYPEYETRLEQLSMAEAVAEAFNTAGFAAIEAGTGGGKSMAYLLPAALFAKRNGLSCGIATKSNALLDQLMYHELPRLNCALEAQGAGGLEYLSLKGYEHYPCLRKLLAAPATNKHYKGRPALTAQLLSYACQSVSGDLDALRVWRGDVPRFEYLASAEDCLGYRCRYYQCCLLHSMRRQAKNADIVVTNHSLLFCDVMCGGTLLPPVRHWIIDEAHGTEDEARRQLSNELDARTLTEALRALTRGGGLLESIRTKAASNDEGRVVLGLATKLGTTAGPVDALASTFFSAVADLAALGEKSDYNQMEIWLNERARASVPWGQVASTGSTLGTHMEALAKQLKDLISALSELPEFAQLQSTLAGHTMVVSSALGTLRLILDGTNASYVYSALLDKRSHLNANKLVASYYAVGEVLAEEFYPQQLSVVYTSATIALGGSGRQGAGRQPAGRRAVVGELTEFAEFGEGRVRRGERVEVTEAFEFNEEPPEEPQAADFGYFKRGVGLDLLDTGRVSTLKLDSSYDFDTNMTVFVPTNMLAPNDYGRRAEYLGQLDDLLFATHKAMGGSVLTLFTNRREMEEAFERLRPAFEANGLDVVCQFARTSRTRLRESFIQDKALSLFALRSFWEGFDAPGDTLRCVIIPKLAFGRPNDPLQQERSRREKGAWSRYVLPEAVISLKQAAGRLIRSSSDSGFLVLADARLVTKFYGREFLAALPSQNIHYLSIKALAAHMRAATEQEREEEEDLI
jgi:ATP-dependent DNA helicase DinG